MKLLFVFLLVLSIAFFAVMQWGGELTGAAQSGQTLAELNPEKIILLDRPVAGQMPGAAVSAVAASAPAATLLPAASAVPATAAPAPLAASAPAPSPAPAPVTAPVQAPAKPAVAPVTAAPPVLPAPAPAMKAAAKACMQWGEFSGGDLARANKSLAALNLGNSLAQHVAEYNNGYWVYMQPLKNKAAVKRKIAEIRALGISDYFVVHEPPKLDNVISLGVFKTSDAAKNFLATLQKKGIRTAVVGERKQKLKFIVFEFRNIDADAVAHLSRLQKDYTYSELNTISCVK